MCTLIDLMWGTFASKVIVILIALTYVSYNRHSHSLIDKYNQNFTVRFQGYGNNPGIESGINTMTEFDKEMRNSFKSIKFDIFRKVAVLDVKKFFSGWINYNRYGTTKRTSESAQAQGGRDEEALHIHFYKQGTNAVVKYKFYEGEDVPYLPRKSPIKVISQE